MERLCCEGFEVRLLNFLLSTSFELAPPRALHHLGNSQPQVCARAGLQAWICQGEVSLSICMFVFAILSFSLDMYVCVCNSNFYLGRSLPASHFGLLENKLSYNESFYILHCPPPYWCNVRKKFDTTLSNNCPRNATNLR